MTANPVLAEARRGNWVENRHRGAFVFARADGSVVACAGDIDRPIFPRSAIKAMQALPMFSSGAVDRFDLGAPEIALACASHNAEPPHVEAVSVFLDKIGCDISDLECGAQPPVDAATKKSLREAGEPFSAIHNNCSGKHSGMLAVAKALGVPTAGYVGREHEVQKHVRRSVEAVIGTDLTTDRCGVDGCSIPTWAAPLNSFAQGFARMATGEGLDVGIADASRRILDAATGHPHLVRGTDMLDTEAMAAFKGDLMLKIGADGVFCGALRSRGIGFALKIDDGNLKVADVVMAGLLRSLPDLSADQIKTLERFTPATLTNWRKIEVGQITATDAARVQLDG